MHDKRYFIKHKEATMIFEWSGLIITKYNTLIIQSESKPVASLIVHYTTMKQQVTFQIMEKQVMPKKLVIIGKMKNL